MASDQLHLARAVARIWKAMFTIGAAGTVLLFAWRGWTWGAGFAFGSAISALYFRWLEDVVNRLGTSKAKPRLAVLLGLRYVLLGGGAYVILKYSAISVVGMFCGLFIVVAAVIWEILYELIYGNRTVDH
jgi:ATP synthase I subunit